MRGIRLGDLVPEVMADILRTVVMVDGQSRGRVFSDGPEALSYALADWLRGLGSGRRAPVRMPTRPTELWSPATKMVICRSVPRTVAVMSAPHIRLTFSGTIVPS